MIQNFLSDTTSTTSTTSTTTSTGFDWGAWATGLITTAGNKIVDLVFNYSATDLEKQQLQEQEQLAKALANVETQKQELAKIEAEKALIISKSEKAKIITIGIVIGVLGLGGLLIYKIIKK